MATGYYRLDSKPYPGLVVVLEEVAQAEKDPLLNFLAGAKLEVLGNLEVTQWVLAHTAGMEAEMAQLEGYEEVMEQLLKALPSDQLESVLGKLNPNQRLAGMKPEQRLAGMKPEQRLAGMKPEERLAGLEGHEALLALPTDVLRGLPEEYIAALPEEVRAEIKRRLQH